MSERTLQEGSRCNFCLEEEIQWKKRFKKQSKGQVKNQSKKQSKRFKKQNKVSEDNTVHVEKMAITTNDVQQLKNKVKNKAKDLKNKTKYLKIKQCMWKKWPSRQMMSSSQKIV